MYTEDLPLIHSWDRESQSNWENIIKQSDSLKIWAGRHFEKDNKSYTVKEHNSTQHHQGKL